MFQHSHTCTADLTWAASDVSVHHGETLGSGKEGWEAEVDDGALTSGAWKASLALWWVNEISASSFGVMFLCVPLFHCRCSSVLATPVRPLDTAFST